MGRHRVGLWLARAFGGAGTTIAQLGHWAEAAPPHTAQQAVDIIAADLESFVVSQAIDHLIMLNVASTEPPFPLGEVHRHWDTLNPAMTDGGPGLLPASALYAV